MTQDEIKRAKELSKKVKGLSLAPKAIVVTKTVSRIPSPYKFKYETLRVKDGKDGATPKRGVDYLTDSELTQIKEDIRRELAQEHGDIVTTILEKIREEGLRMSDIKDADSFIMRSREGMMTKYKFEELMHGGSGNYQGVPVYNEVVDGSGTSWTLAHTPISGTLQLYANGQRLMETTDYTISGRNITTLTVWATGTLLADYAYNP